MQVPLEHWVIPDRMTLLFWLIDLGLVSTVLVYGLLTHAVDPLVEVDYTLRVLAPFWIAWTLIGPICGVYSSRARNAVGWNVGLTILAWSLAAGVGSVIRATGFFPGNAPFIFVLVTVGVGLPVLVVGRLIVMKIILISYENI